MGTLSSTVIPSAHHLFDQILQTASGSQISLWTPKKRSLGFQNSLHSSEFYSKSYVGATSKWVHSAFFVHIIEVMLVHAFCFLCQQLFCVSCNYVEFCLVGFWGEDNFLLSVFNCYSLFCSWFSFPFHCQVLLFNL